MFRINLINLNIMTNLINEIPIKKFHIDYHTNTKDFYKNSENFTEIFALVLNYQSF